MKISTIPGNWVHAPFSCVLHCNFKIIAVNIIKSYISSVLPENDVRRKKVQFSLIKVLGNLLGLFTAFYLLS